MNQQNKKGYIDIQNSSNEDIPLPDRVDDLPVSLRKITSSDDGKVQLVFEAEALSDEGLANLKGLISIQQQCKAFLSLEPAQKDLLGG